MILSRPIGLQQADTFIVIFALVMCSYQMLSAAQQAPLSPPTNLSAFVEGSRQIYLTWEAPPSDSLQGNFVNYIVRFQEKSLVMPKYRSTFQPNYTLTDLKPFTTYRLSVAVQNDAMEGTALGPYSEDLEATTEEDIPSAPLNLRKFGFMDDQFVILWGMPRHKNGDLLGFFVYMKEEGEDTWNKRETTENVFAFLYLQPFTRYEVQASARTKVGEGPNSTAIVVTTDIAPASAPRNVSVGSITNVSALITWMEPAVFYNSIDAYIIKYWEHGQLNNLKKETVQIGKSKILTNLTSGLSYFVTVSASTLNIQAEPKPVRGEESSAVSFMVPEYALFPGTTSVVVESPFNITLGIMLVLIPVILLVTAAIFLFVIVRRQRKNNFKIKKTTKTDDSEDKEYANAAMADNPEDYIPLEEQSRTVLSSDYQDLGHGSSSMSSQYEETIVLEQQQAEATLGYQTRTMKGVNSGAYEDVGVSSQNRQLPDVPQSHPSGDEDEDNSYEVPDKLEEYAGVYINVKNKSKLVQPGPIKVAEFQNFMTRSKEDVVSDIVRQFMALPSGEQYPCSVALKFQNKPKNFYKSVLPYNHSRVKLDTNASNARSDYVNASYIKNHHGKPSFIAAQGPQEGTMNNFWEMVWQENVETIVMVTDISERDKPLCSTYWPSQVHMGEAYGAITVILMESTNFTSHTIRKLSLLKGKDKAEVHTVTQIHVYSWPYGGVPKEPTSLVSIIKKVKSLRTNASLSPLLVHCSNGVGATGTFIAAYVLMDVIKKNKEISVFEFVKRMRDDRVKMVQSRIQYLFIFEFLLAVLQSAVSEMSCDQLKQATYTGIKLNSAKEFKVLQESLVQDHQCENYVGNSLENQHKNRFSNIVPDDKNRPALKSEGNTFGSSNYINAFHVLNFCGREFIMTQTPLSSTVEDFWRLVYDYECTTIVMLNIVGGSDETIVQYWPGGGSVQYGLMAVVCTSTTKSDSCVHSQFQLSHIKVKKTSVSVDHFAFRGWSGNQPDVSKLMEFIRTTGNKGQGPILIQCINGVGLSAVYVIVKTESKRLEQDGFVDVLQSLKKLRKNCPFAIQTQEEYTLCYQLLKDHLDNPDEYAVVY